MTGAMAAGRRPAAADVVDAEYETVGAAPMARAPAPKPVREAAPVAGLRTLHRIASPTPPRPRWQRGGPIFWATGIGLAAAAFWVSGGHALFDLGALYEGNTTRAGLRIAGLASRVEQAAARSVLMVDGEAVNDGAERRTLPPLAIDVTGIDGTRTRYRLGTSGRFLAGGERFAFSARFEVPKEGVKTVSVAFVE